MERVRKESVATLGGEPGMRGREYVSCLPLSSIGISLNGGDNGHSVDSILGHHPSLCKKFKVLDHSAFFVNRHAKGCLIAEDFHFLHFPLDDFLNPLQSTNYK